MGTIVDQNSNPASVDSWALVSGTTVSNIIAAAFSYIESIQGDYDYLVNITVGEQNVSSGWVYDPENDSFSDPTPPPDYASMLSSDVNNLISLLIDMVNNSSQILSGDVDSIFSQAETDNFGILTANQSDILDAISSYCKNGG